MKRVSVFVDGNYVQSQINKSWSTGHQASKRVPIDYPSLSNRLQEEVQDQVPESYLLRIYWYDCLVPTRSTEDHEAVKELDNFKLRLDVEGNVSSRMMSDLMILAQQRAMTHALLVTDRVCLAPSVEVVQSMGLRVHLLSLGEPSAMVTALAAEADLMRSWSVADIQRFASRPLAVPDAPKLGLWTEAAWAAPDTPVAMPHSEEVPLARVAEVANARIKEGPQSMVLAALKPGMRALPREVDSALLSVGRHELGRALTETEKRQLRREFQALIRRNFEDRLSKTYGHLEVLA